MLQNQQWTVKNSLLAAFFELKDSCNNTRRHPARRHTHICLWSIKLDERQVAAPSAQVMWPGGRGQEEGGFSILSPLSEQMQFTIVEIRERGK